VWARLIDLLPLGEDGAVLERDQLLYFVLHDAVYRAGVEADNRLAGILHTLETPAKLARLRAQAAAQVASLTPAEREVLRMLSQGQTNLQIAQNLLVSRGTVKVHVGHIIAKLGVSDRTAAAVRALEAGLVGAGTLLPRAPVKRGAGSP
jgi:DNA-binding NarL/FixJ family response regulator